MTISSSNSVTSLRLFCGVGVVYEPIQEQEQSVARCLSGKGYVLGS